MIYDFAHRLIRRMVCNRNGRKVMLTVRARKPRTVYKKEST